MKKLLLAIIALTHSFMTVSASEKVIDQTALPSAARTFVTSHFSKDKISIATMEKSGLSKEYKVILESGAEIEFSSKGEWTEIECRGKNSSVPSTIIPAKITQYVKSKFPSGRIVKIEQDRRGYDIELHNEIELEFDSNGELIKFD